MQSSDSFHGFGYTFWTFWIIALHLLYMIWISNILAKSISEETCIVEMRIWCKKIGIVNFIPYHPVRDGNINKMLMKSKKTKSTELLGKLKTEST